MDFLPKGHQELKTEKAYINISKLPEGEYRFRIAMRPIAGWLDWEDKKPHRYKPEEKPAKPFDATRPIRPFWACYVWDYAKEGLYIVEFVQSSILKGLTDLGKDSDWGDFTQYDIKVKKVGTGKDTKYSVTPLPHKPLGPKIEEALKQTPVCLEALYVGGDPWKDFFAEIDEDDSTIPTKTIPLVEEPMEVLKQKMAQDGLSYDHFEEYIASKIEQWKKTREEILEATLSPNLYDTFKKSYLKFLKRFEQAA